MSSGNTEAQYNLGTCLISHRLSEIQHWNPNVFASSVKNIYIMYVYFALCIKLIYFIIIDKLFVMMISNAVFLKKIYSAFIDNISNSY